MSSLARRLGHEAGALAICAETRRPPGAREERREPMRAEPVKNAASPHRADAHLRQAVRGAGRNDNPVGRRHGSALAAGRRPCKRSICDN